MLISSVHTRDVGSGGSYQRNLSVTIIVPPQLPSLDERDTARVCRGCQTKGVGAVPEGLHDVFRPNLDRSQRASEAKMRSTISVAASMMQGLVCVILVS